MPYFVFTGSDPADAAHYTLLQTGTPTCLGNEEQICAIQALNDGNGNPVLDIPMLSEMVRALNVPESTTNVKLKECP